MGNIAEKPVTSASGADFTLSARGAIKRLIGNKADNIIIQPTSSDNGNDTYEIESQNGILTIKGSSAVAICYGFHNYLGKACHSMSTWSGAHLNIPDKWPEYKKERVSSPYQYRYYLNVVTFGYTTPYWDWARWEKELDWMAFHGINMPLTAVANEAIAARVWRKLGLKDKEIANFFTGPAFLPWHRMGNLNGWDGPLRDRWHKSQLILEHKIIARMHELGFEPIAPAFAGFVPEEFKKKHPELQVKKLTWGGFPEKNNAYVLAPDSPFFKIIGKMFIQEWEKEFGKNTYYLSDSFNEMDVPVPKGDTEGKYKLLSDYGESIYKSIVAGNPEAIWITQGWTFGYQHKFWDKESLQALLKKVPDDKMVIVDLANEFPQYVWNIEQTWKTHRGFYDKKWIYSYVPNFGGKTPYVGDLSLYASGSSEALNSPFRKKLIGFGSAPEGIENNEVVYELLADMGWTDQKIDLKNWLPEYCKARYGAYPAEMAKAWELLQKSCYGSYSSYPRFTWQTVVPDSRRKNIINKSSDFLHAVESFLACSDQLKESKLYQIDAIELSALYLSIKADNYYQLALKADSIQDMKKRDDLKVKVISLLESVDRLLQSHSQNKLQVWVNRARSHGSGQEEKNYYESDAKRLITTWGGKQDDYAARLWGGLIRDYYIPRIEIYFSPDRQKIRKWEEAWVKKPWINNSQPFSNPVDMAKELIDTSKKQIQ